MHPCRQPRVLQMDVDDITDEDAVRLDGALVPERRVLLGAPALGVVPVIPLEVGRGSAGMCIILPCRDEQMEVRLLARAAQRRRIMKGIGDRQPRPGNGVHQVPRQCQVLSVGEFVRQRDLPLFKRHPVRPLVPFRRTKVGVRIALSPGREIARALIHQVFPVLSGDVARLPRS